MLLKSFADHNRLGDTVMFGRLHTTFSARERRRLAKTFGLEQDLLAQRFTEGLFKELGASSVRSIDVSDYEGCDMILDLTRDVAADDTLAGDLVDKFDTVLDFGTSEHIFNFPQTLVNAWNMLRDGGAYIFDMPVTGWASHGLVQFTPNYFHSVGEAPYFDLEHMFFHPKRGERIYEVRKFNSISYRLLNGRRRISAWGVLRKTRPEGMVGPLKLTDLRVLQSDIRTADHTHLPKRGLLSSVSCYGMKTIGSRFDT